MALKFAAVLNAGADRAAVVRRMLAALCVRKWQQPSMIQADGVALGFVRSTPAMDPPGFVRQTAEGVWLVSGMPTCLDGPVDAVLAAAARENDPGRLAELEGAFAALHWDCRLRRLTVITDFLGLQPLYVARSGGKLLLATELKGIAAAQDQVHLDSAAWGAFIAMGHCLGDATLLAGAKRVPSAVRIAWDETGRKVEERRYWSFPAPAPRSRPDTGSLVSVLEREIHAYARYPSPGVVLLSGGFDSRLILCLLRRLRYAPAALTVSHPGERLDADGRFARAIAARLEVPSQFCAVPGGFSSSSAYLDYLAMNEVSNPSVGLFIAGVSSFVRPELGAVWEGVAPGYTLAGPAIAGRPTLANYLKRRLQPPGAPVWAAARLIFRRAPDMELDWRRDLKWHAGECAEGDSGLLQFEARHQMRNRMGHNPIKVYSNDVLCYTPGTSRPFWTLAAAIPYAEKRDFRLYFNIFRQHFPEALETPFCSMGRLWTAGFRPDPFLHLARLFPPPGARAAAKALRSLGLGGRLPGLVERTVALVDAGHPDLDPDGLARLKAGAVRLEVARQARLLLFHWQTWRWIMEGRLPAARPAVVAEGIR